MVRPDEPAVVRLAVDHLLGCGLRHFAYCGFAGLGYSESRCRYFVRYVAESGREPHVYQAPHPTRGSTSTIEDHGLIDENDVAAWLRSLPKPLGLVACNDIRAQQVLNACTEYGIAVPRDVAVIGVDNDEVLCELAYPPLSSVELNVPRIGYEAAALLDGMMRGLPPAAEETAVAPLGIVARESTNVLAVPDDLAAALRFIRERACDGIDVPEVLRHVLLSRSTLERRFAAFIGSTPKAEILRVKIQRVKELLSTTDLPLARIAPLAGFNNVEPMCNLFKSKTGRSPGQYRKESRA
jgi:LacI family transcriptional regulator